MANTQPPRRVSPPEQERPDVDDDGEPLTNPEAPVFPEYVKRKVAELEDSFDESLRHHDNRLTWRSIFVAVGAVTAGVLAAIMFVDNRVAAQTDAGVKVIEHRVTTLEQEVPQLRQEVFEARKETRADLKALQDALLTRRPARRLEEPVPPPAGLDGGHR